MRRLAVAAVATALLAAAAPLRAQSLPLGGQFPVNSYTTGFQGVPRVASAADGSFVVVWASSGGQDGDDTGVFGRRFDRHGLPDGGEFRVNSYTTSVQTRPAVAADAAGNFVVVWQSANQESPGSYGVFGQRFDPSGVKQGSEFQVNTYTTGYQDRPSVALADSGAFVVVWEGYGQDGSRWGVFGQRFNAAGAKLGSEFQVNTVTFGDQRDPAVGVDGAGRFIVVWSSTDFEDLGIFGQRFNALGARVGSEFQVNGFTPGKQQLPAIAVDRRGNFLVAWQGPESEETFTTNVFARGFDVAGEPVGYLLDEPVVNDFAFNVSESQPSVAIGRGGHFLVAWSARDDSSGTSRPIAGQRLDRTGSKIGKNFQLSGGTQDFEVSIAEGGTGLVAAWSGNDGSSSGILARRQIFTPSALAVDSRTTPNTASDANGVFEPGENPLIEPTWRNHSPFTFDTAGAVTVSGPAGASYFLPDDSASYGSVAPDAAASCANGNPDACYIALIFTLGARPATHWDAILKETPNVGVGPSSGNSTSGTASPTFRARSPSIGRSRRCSTTGSRPAARRRRTARDSRLPRADGDLHREGDRRGRRPGPDGGLAGGSAYDCSAGGHSLFSDVAPTSASCRHLHFLAAQNVTLGCAATQYCPTQAITRDAMASFIAKAIVAPGGGNAVPLTYTDPITALSYSCSPGSPNLHFADVPVSNAFCKHIHYLWARGIVAGCSATTYCPASPVARDAMAKFIANGFGLQLYGP